LLAHAAVPFLLRFWEEEEAFVTTLDAVHVVIHMEKTNSEHRSGDNSFVHLTHRPRIVEDHREDGQLDEGQLWQHWHHKSLFNFLDFISGLWGILFHSLAVTWHFYFILRN